MLTLTIPAREWFDDEKGEFHNTESVTLRLEHSLVSLAEWESKWRKPFLGREEKTAEESLDYVRCMTLSPKDLDPMFYEGLTADNLTAIRDYIDAPMTATWFSDKENKRISREIVTAEVIYYWMIALGIPFECQRWHLNRLMTLVRVCSIKQAPPKKGHKGTRTIAASRRALNDARRAQTGSYG